MSLRALLDGLEVPILQAPMVGASSTRMALAVCGAGGLGSLAAGAMAPEAIEAEVAAFREASAAPFGVNLLMAPSAAPDAASVEAALARLAPWYADLGEPLPARPNSFAPDFEAQFAALVRAAPPVASFTFGILTKPQAAALRAVGTFIVGTATNVPEARAWADIGADGICAQGFEAGGHRGHFLSELDASLVGTMALTSLVLEVSAPWRQALVAAPDDATRLTRAFTGRHARGIENRYMREMASVQDEVPAYPVQNRLTQPLRAAAASQGNAEMISLWAGQGVRLAEPGDAGELVRRWRRQAEEAARRALARTARDTGGR
jgi:nitronate monooxygenase